MTTRRSFWKGFALTFGMLAGVGVALAATFNLFQPANGILKGNPSTYVTTAATSADVVATFSGTCTGTNYLAANGTCQPAPAAPPTPANPTASVGLTAVNGVATTYMRSDAAPALSQAIGPTWTGAHTFTNSVLISKASNSMFAVDRTDATANNRRWRYQVTSNGGWALATEDDAGAVGTAAFSAARSGTAVSSVVLGNAIDNPTITVNGGVVVSTATGGNQGTGTVNATGLFVNGTAVCQSSGTNCPGGASAGNPTASVGLTAVNGVATSYMRSDAAPALSQAISPTWTGSHTFSNQINAASINASVASGPSLTANSTSANGPYVTMSRNGTPFADLGNAPNIISGSTLDGWAVATRGASSPIQFGYNGSVASRLYANFTPTAFTFGNTTDNPTYSFAGTGGTTFNGSVLFTSAGTANAGVRLSSDQPTLTINETDAAPDNRLWRFVASNGLFSFGAINDAISAGSAILEVARSGITITSLSFGNATDNPTYSFAGSGTASFTGNVTVGGSSVCRANGTNCPAGAAKTAAGYMTVSGGVCTVSRNIANISSCNYSGVGNYSVSYGSTYSQAPVCTITVENGQAAYIGRTSTVVGGTNVTLTNTAGSPADGNFYVTCMGN